MLLCALQWVADNLVRRGDSLVIWHLQVRTERGCGRGQEKSPEASAEQL